MPRVRAGHPGGRDGNTQSFTLNQTVAAIAKVSLESVNYPGYYLRHRGFQFYIETGSGDLYNQDCTFSAVVPLAR